MLEKPPALTRQFQEQFQKSFVSFCRRLPIIVFFVRTPTMVFLYEKQNDKVEPLLEYTFDFDKNVKENIYEIKQLLIPRYPVIKEKVVTESEYTVEELAEMAKKDGTDVEVLVDMKKTTASVCPWRIEKVNLRKDEFLVRDMNTGETSVRKSRIPVSLFLKFLRMKKFDHRYYLEKSFFLKEVVDSAEREYFHTSEGEIE